MSRKTYPIKWWQLWRWNPYWQCYGYRYRWIRDLASKLGVENV